MLRPLLVGLVSLASAACSGVFAKDNGRAPGDDLGRFRVAATLDSSTCGAAALGAPDKWQFDVVLSRDAPSLYWNTAQNAISGSVDAEGRFSFQSETVVNASTKDAGSACAIVRKDTASGTFDNPNDAKAFGGTLEYAFSPQGTADCSEAMLEDGFATLPCTMTYRMQAAWVADR